MYYNGFQVAVVAVNLLRKKNRMGNDKEKLGTHDIVAMIISGINKGRFIPGHRLPSQRDMAKLFGVSRTVIREAVKILEGRQIVKSKQGSGIYVCDIPNVSQVQPVSTPGYTIELTVKDLLEVAWMFWDESIRLMARNSTQEEINILAEMTQSLHKRLSKSTVQERYIYETTFGRITTRYSHNPLMHRLMDDLFEATSEIDYKVVSRHSDYREIVEIDLKIIDAMQERNGERAYHLACERDRVISHIISQDEKLMSSTFRINLSISTCD
ncbi:MAG: GntR family transcriptional regulator [Syntrophomonadaceae bacterium]|nr:GntR family transcriptional regulator [Syntrophomonadaceae bacterium]